MTMQVQELRESPEHLVGKVESMVKFHAFGPCKGSLVL